MSENAFANSMGGAGDDAAETQTSADDKAADAKEFAAEQLETLERKIREKPLQAAAIAAGAGFVLALLLRR